MLQTSLSTTTCGVRQNSNTPLVGVSSAREGLSPPAIASASAAVAATSASSATTSAATARVSSPPASVPAIATESGNGDAAAPSSYVSTSANSATSASAGMRAVNLNVSAPPRSTGPPPPADHLVVPDDRPQRLPRLGRLDHDPGRHSELDADDVRVQTVGRDDELEGLRAPGGRSDRRQRSVCERGRSDDEGCDDRQRRRGVTKAHSYGETTVGQVARGGDTVRSAVSSARFTTPLRRASGRTRRSRRCPRAARRPSRG